MKKGYEIRFMIGTTTMSQGFGEGYGPMEAAENSIENGSHSIPPGEIVDVLAINMTSGISFKFSMAQAT